MNKAMGHWVSDPNASVDDGPQWWMLEDETVPYSPATGKQSHVAHRAMPLVVHPPDSKAPLTTRSRRRG
jgi:hypothetical protein